MFRGNNPFFSSYAPYYPQQHPDHAHTLAAQQARRARWLPDEADDDHGYNHLGARERAWANPHQNQAAIERERQQRLQEGLRRRAEEEQGWEQQLDWQQKEDQETRGRRLEEERAGEIEAKREVSISSPYFTL